MTPEQENHSRQALAGMKTIKLDGPFPYGADDLSSLLQQSGIANASINLRNHTATGFTAGGISAIAALAKTFRPSLSQSSYRASNATLAKLIAGEIIGKWAGRSPTTLAQADFDELQSAVHNWFASLTAVREHVVPCSLFPGPVPSFSIGPVTFRHFSEMPTDGFGVSREEFWPKPPPAWRKWVRDVWAALRGKTVAALEIGGFRFSMLVRFATERNSPWLAFVAIPGRPDAESIRAADISTDIALAAIQLVSPGSDMRAITRASARAAPIWRVDVSRTMGGGFNEGTKNLSPALARSPELIALHIQQIEPALRSMGQRLSGFIAASSIVPDLDEAWCNAAYWYHEALAEHLDTVAVAKLETAIEVLFRSASMSGSKRRLLESFEAFFGLRSTDPIGQSGPVTVEQFVEAITTARSRVLHGTWPTLQFDLPANKSNQTISYGDVEMLTRALLLQFSVHLDAYLATGNATDSTDAFFAWLMAERATQAASVTQTPPAR